MIAAAFSAVVVLVFFADRVFHSRASNREDTTGPIVSPVASAASVGFTEASPDIASPSAEPSNTVQPTPSADPEPTPEATPTPAAESETPPKTGAVFEGSVVPDNIADIAVAEGETKDSDWFSDAVLIGDSRVDGFRLYSGASEADYIVRAGMSVYEVVKEKQNVSSGGTKYSVYQLLGSKQYAKVYLSIGINELGYYNPKGYADTYEKIIDKVHQLQPDAQIYVMTLIPVNAKACEKSKQSDYINNDLILQYNTALVKMAAEKDVLLVNAAEALAGEDGELLEDMTSDGVHFIKDGYVAWKDYLLCHTGT